MPPEAVSGFFCPTRLHVGIGAHRMLASLISSWGCDRLFAAVDAALLETEFFREVKKQLESTGAALQVFSAIEPDPSVRTVESAYAQWREHGATALLAVGGGSTMDVAKAVGILATNGGRIQDYEGIEKFSKAPLRLVAIPTTAGTGSEVSGSCVITDTETNRKLSIRHAALNPAAVAILDPLALRTAPAHVAAHSGIDAFVHAFESYISLGANPFTDAVNLHAIELLSSSIRPFVASRENLHAGLNMLCGSALAGMAFGQTGLGNVHCMARFVGAEFHLSHGQSNAMCLPHVARFNLIANPEKYAKVARAMGRAVQAMPVLDAAGAAVEAIEALCRDLGIPQGLQSVGATREVLPRLAEQCAQANYNRWNPRHTTAADFLALFNAAY